MIGIDDAVLQFPLGLINTEICKPTYEKLERKCISLNVNIRGPMYFNVFLRTNLFSDLGVY